MMTAATTMDQSMMDSVISLAEWKAQKRAQRHRLIMAWYPAELIGYEDGMPRCRWELIDASSALEPKVCF
jgi:hypothetical protein